MGAARVSSPPVRRLCHSGVTGHQVSCCLEYPWTVAVWRRPKGIQRRPPRRVAKGNAMLDSGPEQPLAATEVSFHAFPAPRRPTPPAKPGRQQRATRDDEGPRLIWPPADVGLGQSGQIGPSICAPPVGLPAHRGQTSSIAACKSDVLAATGEMTGSHDLDWLIKPIGPPIRQDDGAPAVSMPGLAGRFASEWCPASATSDGTGLRRVRGRTNGRVMVRRAILDHGDDLAADDEALPLSQVPAARPEQARAHWRGAGGRWPARGAPPVARAALRRV